MHRSRRQLLYFVKGRFWNRRKAKVLMRTKVTPASVRFWFLSHHHHQTRSSVSDRFKRIYHSFSIWQFWTVPSSFLFCFESKLWTDLRSAYIGIRYLVLKKILTSSGTERGSICRRVPKWLVGQRSSSASAMLPCEPEAKGYFLTYIITHDQRRLTEQIKFE